jgi:hypothetical protein
MTELELPKDLPFWDQNKMPSASDIPFNDSTILFQILFALHVTNSKYGITPTDLNNISIEKGNVDIALALEIDGVYDVFRFNTQNRVVLTSKKFALDANVNTNQIADLFKSLLNQNEDGKLLYKQLVDPKQDYGSGISWGINLALFHPYFKRFYTEETSAISGTELYVYENGHQPMWTQLDDDTKKDRAAARAKFTQIKIPLDKFKPIITRLLNMYQANSKDFEENVKDLKEIYTAFRQIYSEKQLQGIGNLDEYFTEKNGQELKDAKVFTPQPTKRIVSSEYLEVEPRTKGYIAVILSLIAKISIPEFFVSVEKIDKALSSSNEFNEASYPNIERVYNSFSEIFTKQRTEYERFKGIIETLEAKKYVVEFRKAFHPIKRDNLIDARDVFGKLREENNPDDEIKRAEKVIKYAQEEDKENQKALEESNTEKRQYDDVEEKWTQLQSEFEKAKNQFELDGSTYSGLNMPNDLPTDVLKTTPDFNNELGRLNAEIQKRRKELLTPLLEATQKKNPILPLRTDLNLELYDISALTREEIVKAYNIVSSSPLFQPLSSQLDGISNDSFRLTGLLHAMWGETQDTKNENAIVRGLNMIGN